LCDSTGGIRDSFKNLRVTSAAAKIAGQSLADVRVVRVWIFTQQVNGGKDHSGGTNAALRAAAIEKSLLQRVQTLVDSQALDGRDVGTRGLQHGYQAAVDQNSIEQHGAGTALAFATAFLGACQSNL
jgi:preprotein translocase subunit SecF